MANHRPGARGIPLARAAPSHERATDFSLQRAPSIGPGDPVSGCGEQGDRARKPLPRPSPEGLYLLARVIPFPPEPPSAPVKEPPAPRGTGPGKDRPANRPREGRPGCPLSDRSAQGWNDPGSGRAARQGLCGARSPPGLSEDRRASPDGRPPWLRLPEGSRKGRAPLPGFRETAAEPWT